MFDPTLKDIGILLGYLILWCVLVTKEKIRKWLNEA